MVTHRLRLTESRPFFAEFPYYLWGQVNYDSEGDCKSPTDRDWTWLDLTNRETREHLDITIHADSWEVTGADPLTARAALFLASRWVDWYFAGDGILEYPKPDFEQWHADLKAQVPMDAPGS